MRCGTLRHERRCITHDDNQRLCQEKKDFDENGAASIGKTSRRRFDAKEERAVQCLFVLRDNAQNLSVA
jgi:hypothetical protein